jgi:xylan 1,4-beta-xylosidase
VTILAWHYHDDDVAGPAARVELLLRGLGKTRKLELAHYRIDEWHSNAYAAWQRMGSPPAPNRTQYNELLAASRLTQLEQAPARVQVREGFAKLEFDLPRQAVSLLVLERFR